MQNIEDQNLVYAEVVTVNDREHNVTENMLKAYNLGQSVIMFAIIDVFFSILYAVLNYWFFIPILLALCGYYGAKNYNKCLTFIYGGNIFLVNAVRVGYSSYLYYNLSGDDKSQYTYSFVLIVLCGLIGLWIAKIICKFYSSLNKLNENEKNVLKVVRYLENSRIIYW